ncbi:MAG: hypothetical protein ACKOW5_13165 [Actinomycetales bacterium]
MPSDITTPAPAAAIDRLTLTTDSIQGTEASGNFLNTGHPFSPFADDAE